MSAYALETPTYVSGLFDLPLPHNWNHGDWRHGFVLRRRVTCDRGRPLPGSESRPFLHRVTQILLEYVKLRKPAATKIALQRAPKRGCLSVLPLTETIDDLIRNPIPSEARNGPTTTLSASNFWQNGHCVWTSCSLRRS
jgi:hypothetical protein